VDDGLGMHGVGLAAALALSIVFLAAGTAKLKDTSAFQAALRTYGWIPDRAIPPLALLVPAAELACAVSLAIPAATRIAAAVTVALIVVFTGTLVHALVTARNVNCGCFGGTDSDDLSAAALVRNAVLLSLGGVAAIARPVSADDVSLPLVVSGIGTGLVLLLVDQAVSQFRAHWVKADRVRMVR
jgi:uncharacterized membrane protein YphA (DoxX/SURF4 family)